MKKQSKIKLQVAKYLQDTIIKSKEIYANNELILDNLNRQQLIALCKLLNLSFLGPNHYLRFKLHLKLYRLKLDDKLIANEGIENLNVEELQAACQERGMNSFDVSIEHLQSQLQQWLDLHINKHVSLSILLLSNKDQTAVCQSEFRKRNNVITNQSEITLEQLINQEFQELEVSFIPHIDLKNHFSF